MALALLAQEAGLNFVALTVDHALRPESADEAKWVAGEMEKRKIKHVILTYRGKPPKKNVEATAREYRYKLLLDYCKGHGITTLLLGHTADEQAETFLLNLTRGSGLKGLCAMREQNFRNGVEIARPFLDIRKKELQDYLTSRGQTWAEDPSNDNEAFKRVKIRKLADIFEELGLSLERLLSTIKNLQYADEALSYYTGKAIENLVISKDNRHIVLSARELANLPRTTALMSLAAIISPDEHIRGESLVRVLKAMLDGDTCTIAGFEIEHKNPRRIVLAKLPVKC